MNQLSRSLRTNQTDVERLLWERLRNRRLIGTKFRRQQTIGPYIVDFICFEMKLIVELDGSQHAQNVAYDTRRTALLESQGFRVMRFWDNEALSNMDGVLEYIRCELIRLPSPCPLPRVERRLPHPTLSQGERDLISAGERVFSAPCLVTSAGRERP